MTMRSSLFVLTAASLLPAQEITVPDDAGRTLRVFDLRTVLAARAPGPDLRLDGPFPEEADTSDQQIAGQLLARFVEPPLGKHDGLQVLGERWLTLLGSAEQIASVDRILQVVAARRGSQIALDVRVLKLTANGFDQAVRPHVAGVDKEQSDRYDKVLPKAEADAATAAMVAAAGDWMEAPRLSVRPLTRGTMSIAEQIAYIKDFTLTAKDGTFIADPILDTITSGIEIVFDATFLPGDLIGFRCDVTKRDVAQPMREYTTTLPGTTMPVKVQLPEVRGVRLQHTAVVRDGDVVVIAAKQADGTFLVALVTAREG